MSVLSQPTPQIGVGPPPTLTYQVSVTNGQAYTLTVFQTLNGTDTIVVSPTAYTGTGSLQTYTFTSPVTSYAYFTRVLIGSTTTNSTSILYYSPYQGPQGVQGNPGAAGQQGPIGPLGPQGPQGLQGVVSVTNYVTCNSLITSGTSSGTVNANANLTFNGSTLNVTGNVTTTSTGSNQIGGVTLNNGALSGITTITASTGSSTIGGVTLNTGALSAASINNGTATFTISNNSLAANTNTLTVSAPTTTGCNAIYTTGTINATSTGTHSLGLITHTNGVLGGVTTLSNNGTTAITAIGESARPVTNIYASTVTSPTVSSVTSLNGITLSGTAVSGMGTLGCGAITSSGTLGLGTNAINCGVITSSGNLALGTNTITCGAITSSGTLGLGANAINCGAITSSGTIKSSSDLLISNNSANTIPITLSNNAGSVFQVLQAGGIGSWLNGTVAGDTVLRSFGKLLLAAGDNIATASITLGNSNGRVGIGTTAPEYMLHVGGNARLANFVFSGDRLSLSYWDTDTGFDWISDGVFRIINNDSETLRISSGGIDMKSHDISGASNISSTTVYATGAVISGTTAGRLVMAGTASACYIEAALNSDTGSAAPLYFTDMNNAHQWMCIGSTGNIGMGVNSPGTKLDVVGSVRWAQGTGDTYQIFSTSNGNYNFGAQNSYDPVAYGIIQVNHTLANNGGNGASNGQWAYTLVQAGTRVNGIGMMPNYGKIVIGSGGSVTEGSSNGITVDVQNKRLGIACNAPAYSLDVSGSVRGDNFITVQSNIVNVTGGTRYPALPLTVLSAMYAYYISGTCNSSAGFIRVYRQNTTSTYTFENNQPFGGGTTLELGTNDATTGYTINVYANLTQINLQWSLTRLSYTSVF